MDSTKVLAVVNRLGSTMKAVRVCFLRNGDPFFRGVMLSVSPCKYKDFGILLEDVTSVLHSHVVLRSGIERLCRTNGTPITFLDSFLDGDIVVCCCRYERFIEMDYSVSRHFGRLRTAIPRWINSRKASNETMPKVLPDSVAIYIDESFRLVNSQTTAICLAKPKTKEVRRCIVKVVNEKYMLNRDAKYKEVEIMRKLQTHPNVVDLIFTVHRPGYSYTFFVIECMACSVQDMRARQGRIPEPTVHRVMRDVACGLTYIHANGIIHRDIKPDNLLLSFADGVLVAKIADFGAATYFEDGAMKGFVGTARYIAPEMILGCKYDYRVDTWSFGVTLFCMLFIRHPFGTGYTDIRDICNDTVVSEYQFPLELKDCISEDAKSLIDALLVKDPILRLTSAEISQHPFMLSGSITDSER
ncbi:serine/threonine-protein kinase DCLK2 [Drosophila pseudoobscura]|uniref:Doublecortin-like and CAM kinase-like protein n=1 Tax=Drosophila pseudoobscura pseudoobscura TaxID=46245 RepID=A0A6I8UME4_DROPS|nr:serine/threonine-protein kinase DCLK2 [Drosophila pseudoobscura]